MNNSIRNFLITGRIEGYSYLALLFIAMPLKYGFGMDIWVRIIGTVHGILFVAFMITILNLLVKRQFNFMQCLKAFLLSIIPFGTFYLKRIL